MSLADHGLNVRRSKSSQTKDERKKNVQTYLVERMSDEDADGHVALVQWVGAGTTEQWIYCARCDERHPVEPACAHIEAVRIELGFREMP